MLWPKASLSKRLPKVSAHHGSQAQGTHTEEAKHHCMQRGTTSAIGGLCRRLSPISVIMSWHLWCPVPWPTQLKGEQNMEKEENQVATAC